MFMRNNKNDVKQEKIEYTNIFKVKRSQELLQFLFDKMSNTSKNNVKTILSKKQVLVNGSVVTQFNYMLANEDEVRISKRPVMELTKAKPVNAKKKKGKLSIDIIYEDDNYIAINKPYNLLSVESDNDRESAYYYLEEFMTSEDKTARPYVIHRIDKETSGVLVFAKNPKVQSILRLHWDEYVIKREYAAVVEGVMDEKEGRIDCYLEEDKNNMMHVSKINKGQKAITNYRVTKCNGAYSLLNVDIETGRKNQIRVVLKSLGHGIVGDEKYGFEKNPFKRLGLHASKLIFKDPITKKEIVITAKLPAAFKALFE